MHSITLALSAHVLIWLTALGRLILVGFALSLAACATLPSYNTFTTNPILRGVRAKHLRDMPLTHANKQKIPLIKQGRIVTGFTRLDVLAAWGPPRSCSRGWQTTRTTCLYRQSQRTLILGRVYKDSTYRSVYYVDGQVVDWQMH